MRTCETCGRRLDSAARYFKERDLCTPCRAKELAEEARLDAELDAREESPFIAGPVTMNEIRDAELTGEWWRELN